MIKHGIRETRYHDVIRKTMILYGIPWCNTGYIDVVRNSMM